LGMSLNNPQNIL